MKHCCEQMEIASTLNCNQHSNEYDCPDVLIKYNQKFDEYGIKIRDGGTSVSFIVYCPYCGAKLPELKRDQWFDKIKK